MIIALLILIIAIMLFGAGFVKGWLKNVIGMIGGFVVMAGLAIWVGSFFGEDGPIWVIMIGMGLLFVLAIWVRSTEPGPPSRPPLSRPSSKRFHSKAPSREERKRNRDDLRGRS
ncbi:hypothetical protein RZN05_02670 [Sphingomonas sp. HF-S4]|uniref:Uncharacterized protein n=1 Tax=Sphingomonas agrestis TaxID=3080540 RepID=A0ABU3Y3R7_9SPHN|nr:hypothetical protein [Sphingomonas sp. HF-S4]MDV3455873.1 hypothetical protein [Sphingomonas sp. HF-S4]